MVCLGRGSHWFSAHLFFYFIILPHLSHESPGPGAAVGGVYGPGWGWGNQSETSPTLGPGECTGMSSRVEWRRHLRSLQGGNTSARALNPSQELSRWRSWGWAVTPRARTVQWGTVQLLWGLSSRCCAPGAEGWPLLRVTEGDLGFWDVALPSFSEPSGQAWCFLLGTGRGWRAVPAQKQEGHTALNSVSLCPNLILFNKCSSHSFLLKFRALCCSTEVYECLKTALRSPK